MWSVLQQAEGLNASQVKRGQKTRLQCNFEVVPASAAYDVV